MVSGIEPPPIYAPILNPTSVANSPYAALPLNPISVANSPYAALPLNPSRPVLPPMTSHPRPTSNYASNPHSAPIRATNPQSTPIYASAASFRPIRPLAPPPVPSGVPTSLIGPSGISLNPSGSAPAGPQGQTAYAQPQIGPGNMRIFFPQKNHSLVKLKRITKLVIITATHRRV